MGNELRSICLAKLFSAILVLFLAACSSLPEVPQSPDVPAHKPVLAPTQAGEPPVPYGATDVTFDASPPHCDADELKARFSAAENAGPYDVTNEKFRLVVPRSYTHRQKWGLFIYINAGDSPGLPAQYLPVLEKRKLLAIAAYRSGNSRDIFDRFRLAIDAKFNLDRRFNIDPNRVYVSGFSGGGRVASMLAVAYADLFSGAIPLSGVNFYKAIPSGDGADWPIGYIPMAPALKIAKTKGRYVLVTGEKDFNRANTRAVFKHGFRKEKFKHALLLEVPGMKHSPPTADWLEKGLEFLDNPKYLATGRTTSTRGGRATIDSDCPYLRVLVAPSQVMDTTRDLELIHKVRQESLANRLRWHLDQVGFKTVRETGSLPNWVLYSNSQELPDKRIVWSLSMQKVPTITDESLLLFQRFSTFSSPGRPDEFSSTSFLKIVRHHEIDDLMVEITEDLAKLWLPSARNQCADMNGTLLEEEAKIRKIREKLTKEMERVRRLRRELERHLEIEVEQ